MKLKIITFLGFITASFVDSYGMQGLKDSIALKADGQQCETFQEAAVELSKTLGKELERNGVSAGKAAANCVKVITGNPAIGPTVIESTMFGANKLVGTKGENLIEILDEFSEKAQPIINEKLIQPALTKFEKDMNGSLDNMEASCKERLKRLKSEAVQSSKDYVKDLKDDTMAYVKSIFNELKPKLLIAGGIVVGTALAYYLIKKYTDPGSLNKNSLKKSNLLVKSSGFINGPMARIASMFKANKSLKKLTLAPAIAQKIKAVLANFMTTIKSLKAGSSALRFKSLLLNGPKGTGKTLFIDHLIQASKLDYIKINSSSFINFEDGTESKAMASLFSLLKKPKKEIIVVIEEADILLNRLAYKNKLLDVLRWIKINNSKFMLIISAENKKLLDKEVIDLIESNVEFALPGESERERYLSQNIEMILKSYEQTGLREILITIFNADKIKQIARQTDGFSYANLEVFLENIKAEILNNSEKYNKELLNSAIQNSVETKAALVY